MTDTPARPSELVIAAVRFDDKGLVPAIAQQFDSGEVLMMAWMNADAISKTLETRMVHYWSRSRSRIWRKGETSGQEQHLKELRWDCDGDTVLVLVDQKGVACHTGRRSCFFNALRNGEPAVISKPERDPDELYRR
jgi:phosphoribosyl-AMP cyclohydrolase